MATTAVLVSSGAFRVDRRRALEKLMRFQLPEPEMWLLPLVRCAVASGAKEIRLADDGGLSLRFDGRPFTREELTDPYGALFEERLPDRVRNRNLALGILCALRLEPREIRVTSSAPGRPLLIVESLERERVEAGGFPAGGTATQVRVSFRGWRFGARRHLDRVREGCRASPIPIFIEGEEVPRFESGEARRATPGEGSSRSGVFPAGDAPSAPFAEEGTRGALHVPSIVRPASEVETYAFGARAGSADFPLPLAQVEGWVNDDGFTLNASQTGVVRDARALQAISIMARHAERLLETAVRSQEKTLALARRAILEESLGPFWRSWIEGTQGALGFFGSAAEAMRKALFLLAGRSDRRAEAARTLAGAARTTAWLRDAALRLAPDAAHASTPLLQALRAAPVFLTVSGKGLGLADLDAVLPVLGYLPFATALDDGRKLPFPVVYASGRREAELLKRRLQGRDITDRLRILGERPRGSTGRSGVERLGFEEPLIRDRYTEGGPEGEIALLPEPVSPGGRVYFLRGGAAERFEEIPGRLRFTAARGLPGPRGAKTPPPPGPGAAETARAAARRLYPRLAADYGTPRRLRRYPGAREHLFDFLLDAFERAAAAGGLGAARAGLCAEDRFIETVPLFEAQWRWCSLKDLRETLEIGLSVFISTSLAMAVPGFGGKNIVRHPRITPEFLAAVLPPTASIEAKWGRRMILLDPSTRTCSREGEGGAACLLEFPWQGAVIHLTAEEAPAGSGIDLPWGRMRVLGEEPRGPLPPEIARKAGLRFLLALLCRHGTLHAQPDHPMRRLILKAAGALLAPWKPTPPVTVSSRPPAKGAARIGFGERIAAVLTSAPMFRGPNDQVETLQELEWKMGSAVTYAASGEKDARPSLFLDEAEAAFIRKLFPDRARNLIPWRTGAAEESGAPRRLEFTNPTVFSRYYKDEVLEAHLAIGLYGGAPEFFSADSPDRRRLAGPEVPSPVYALVEVRGPREGEALRDPYEALLRKFYDDLCAAWPLGGGGGAAHGAAVDHVLQFLRAASANPKERAGLEETGRRLAALPIFRTLGGSWINLQEMTGPVLARRTFVHAEAPPEGEGLRPAGPGEAWIPVCTAAQAYSAARAIRPDGKLRIRSHGRGEDGPPPFEEPPETGAPLERVAAVREILAALRGRRGMRLPFLRQAAETIRWKAGSGRHPVLVRETGTWEIHGGHPLIAAVADSRLPPAQQAAYLASIAYTSANRQMAGLTDLDDVRFQEALADLRAERPSADAPDEPAPPDRPPPPGANDQR